MESDAELLRSREAEDFGRFYERHIDAVTAYVARRVVSPELTFDVVAETFARALVHRGRFDERRGPAVAWLIQIATPRRARQNCRDPRTSPPDASPAAG